MFDFLDLLRPMDDALQIPVENCRRNAPAFPSHCTLLWYNESYNISLIYSLSMNIA